MHIEKKNIIVVLVALAATSMISFEQGMRYAMNKYQENPVSTEYSDDVYPYEWDTLQTKHWMLKRGTHSSSLLDINTTFHFNEEYINFDEYQFVGRWVNPNLFVSQFDTLFITKQNVTWRDSTGRTFCYFNR